MAKTKSSMRAKDSARKSKSSKSGRKGRKPEKPKKSSSKKKESAKEPKAEQPPTDALSWLMHTGELIEFRELMLKLGHEVTMRNGAGKLVYKPRKMMALEIIKAYAAALERLEGDVDCAKADALPQEGCQGWALYPLG
jgi:hypothetical protein